ncbi:anti-sigma factor domain-containing protein [Roseateles asaccharophilus]|uniref:Anti-sigma-K factor RskA n=1 Tax=Roseateles asaccharophilus TaxID=582607 RepID=A0ABU2A6R4_9BURK|nr:anti-sigma factor [Roseateles asaccharophilus]MDR7332891.1 anti-sigma-K factor RskA [Roseateles asaccharophilus]
MDYAHPQRADRLAAEYALGSLRGGARRRFERLLPSHPALAAATADWQDRLQLLAGQIEPVTPPASVWLAVQTRLFGAANDAQAAPPTTARLRLWQGFSAVALAASVVLALQLARPQPEAAPVVVVLRSTPEGVDRVLTGFVASVSADGRTLVLKPLAPLATQPGRALELWAVPRQGEPRSLGLVQAGDVPTTVRRAGLLDGTQAFAVSLEPAGGSPTGRPTGPIVSAGGI